MAQRGYDDGVCAPDWPDRPRPGGQHRGREDRLTALEEYLADREKELTTTVGRVIEPSVSIVSRICSTYRSHDRTQRAP